jgi:hypothetical protein
MFWQSADMSKASDIQRLTDDTQAYFGRIVNVHTAALWRAWP